MASVGCVTCFGCTVMSTVIRAGSSFLQRPRAVRDAQALLKQHFQLGADALPPVAEPGALVRQRVLEEGLAGEVLEVRIVHPALAHPLVGGPVDGLQQRQADHEAGRHRRAAGVAVEHRQLVVDPRPVDLVAEPHQFLAHVDIWSSRARNRSPDPPGCFLDGRNRAPLSVRKGNHGCPENGIRNREVPTPETGQTRDVDHVLVVSMEVV